MTSCKVVSGVDVVVGTVVGGRVEVVVEIVVGTVVVEVVDEVVEGSGVVGGSVGVGDGGDVTVVGSDDVITGSSFDARITTVC